MLSTNCTFISEKSWKTIRCHSKIVWLPATYNYDVISRNHSNWPLLNLSQNALEGQTNSYSKLQALMFYRLGTTTTTTTTKNSKTLKCGCPPPPLPRGPVRPRVKLTLYAGVFTIEIGIILNNYCNILSASHPTKTWREFSKYFFSSWTLFWISHSTPFFLLIHNLGRECRILNIERNLKVT